MGAASFAVPALDALVEAGHEIAAVYTQPPRPAGRGRAERSTPVHDRAKELGLDVLTPTSLRDADEQSRFAALELDAAVVVAYGLILPKPILDAPRLGCLNIHPSLLPRWRGAAPAARAILMGDEETGVSIIVMDEGLDTGPIVAQRRIAVPQQATTGTFEPVLAQIGADMLIEALADLDAGCSTPQSQGEVGACYAHKFAKEDGRIDWARSAQEIDRQVRALSPWPGAWFALDNSTVKVLAAEPSAGSGPPGTLMTEKFTVACGDGALRLTQVQRAGKAKMAGGDFLLGARLAVGAVLA